MYNPTPTHCVCTNLELSPPVQGSNKRTPSSQKLAQTPIHVFHDVKSKCNMMRREGGTMQTYDKTFLESEERGAAALVEALPKAAA